MAVKQGMAQKEPPDMSTVLWKLSRLREVHENARLNACSNAYLNAISENGLHASRNNCQTCMPQHRPSTTVAFLRACCVLPRFTRKKKLRRFTLSALAAREIADDGSRSDAADYMHVAIDSANPDVCPHFPLSHDVRVSSRQLPNHTLAWSG